MYKLKNYKTRVQDEEHSKKVQEEFYRLGYNWSMNYENEKYLHTEMPFLFARDNGWIGYAVEMYVYDAKPVETEVTLQQLQEMESIADIIIKEMTGKEFVLYGEKQTVNIYYDSKYEIELENFYIDLHIDCQQKLDQIKGEEEVGISNGSYISNSNEIEINQLTTIIYDKESCEPYVLINEDLTTKIENEIINRLKFNY